MMKRKAEAMARAAQQAICDGIEQLEGRAPISDSWSRPDGGGGLSRVLQKGRVFSKAGANVSVVHGPLSGPMQASLELSPELLPPEESHSFFATGVSTVLHPDNPYAPTAHANFRYFEIHRGHNPQDRPSEEAVAWWFGGGADLTPIYFFEEDAKRFHRIHKEACDSVDSTFYPRFKTWCDEYFFLPHRQETRGVGGIFFDRLSDRSPETLLSLCEVGARAFVDAYFPLVALHQHDAFDDRQRHWQRLRRGRYVEFNLLYDRGTSFGLRSDGRAESILMSLPLDASWEYDHQPDPQSPEAELLQVLKTPRRWVP